MSISIVKAGLVDISQSIRTERQAMKNAKARITAAEANLNGLTTTFVDAIAEINGYVPIGEFEALAKDELAQLTVEFQALRDAATGAISDLATITEF